MRSRFVIHLFLLLVLCLPAAAQQTLIANESLHVVDEGGRVENPPDRLSLAYKFKEGDLNRYQVQIINVGVYKLLNQKEESKLKTITEMFFTQKVKPEEEDGLYNVQWTMDSGIVRIPDFGESIISVPEMTFAMDDQGTVKKIKGLDKLAILPGKPQQKMLAELLAQLRFQGFPKDPVKVEDEWTRQYSLDPGENEKLTIKTTSKLLGYEKCATYDCAKIETKYSYPVKLELDDKVNGKLKLEGSESGSFITHFAFKEGKMIRTEGDITVDASVKKADGSGDSFLKVAMNTVSHLLPPKDSGKEKDK